VKEKNIQENIKIRLNLEQDDPLFAIFNAIKKKTALNANTEVLRYAIKKTYDCEIEKGVVT